MFLDLITNLNVIRGVIISLEIEEMYIASPKEVIIDSGQKKWPIRAGLLSIETGVSREWVKIKR